MRDGSRWVGPPPTGAPLPMGGSRGGTQGGLPKPTSDRLCFFSRLFFFYLYLINTSVTETPIISWEENTHLMMETIQPKPKGQSPCDWWLQNKVPVPRRGGSWQEHRRTPGIWGLICLYPPLPIPPAADTGCASSRHVADTLIALHRQPPWTRRTCKLTVTGAHLIWIRQTGAWISWTWAPETDQGVNPCAHGSFQSSLHWLESRKEKVLWTVEPVWSFQQENHSSQDHWINSHLVFSYFFINIIM